MKPAPKHRALALAMARGGAEEPSNLESRSPSRQGLKTAPGASNPGSDLYGTLLTRAQRHAIVQALRHCQGMGFALPLADSEIDALCKRLGDPQ